MVRAHHSTSPHNLNADVPSITTCKMPVADHGTEETTEHLRQLRDTLKQPINTVDELVSLLGQPLDLLGSLPLSSATASKAAWTGPRGSEPRQILLSRLMGSLQTAVLDNVVAVWADNLDDTSPGRRATDLLDSWFCPTRPQEESDRRPNQDAARVALCSYQTLASALAPSRSQGALSDPSSSSSASRPSVPPPSVVAFVLPLLARLSAAYPLSTLYDVLFHSSTAANAAKSSVVWETLARTIVSVPAKVMNATQGGRTASVPSELHQEIWFDRLTREMEVIVRNESVRSDPSELLSADELWSPSRCLAADHKLVGSAQMLARSLVSFSTLSGTVTLPRCRHLRCRRLHRRPRSSRASCPDFSQISRSPPYRRPTLGSGSRSSTCSTLRISLG